MPLNVLSTLSLLALLLSQQRVNAALSTTSTTPQTEPAKAPRACNPQPCANLPFGPDWTPYCYQGALHCTISGLLTVPVGRCEDWCQPEPPKPNCPPPAPPPPEGCETTPCAGLPQEGWEPYCYQGKLYCTIGPGMITYAVGKCEQWCGPGPTKPEGCP